MKRILIAIVLLTCLSYLGGGAAQAGNAPQINVLATTSILADVVAQIGNEWVHVDTLVPPNADAHAWQPTPADLVRATDADVIFTVGAGYEESFLNDLLTSIGDKPLVVASTGIEMLAFNADGAVESAGLLGEAGVCVEDASTGEHDHAHGCDPHVWTTPANGAIWAQNIADALSAISPCNEASFQANASAYIEKLNALDAEIHALLDPLPTKRRVLVTNHAFLTYFADAYALRVVGLVIPSLTTGNTPAPQEIAALIEAAKAAGAPAIFAEISSSTSLAQTIADGVGVPLITDLYSESLSEADGAAPTYLDYLRHNAQVIATALG